LKLNYIILIVFLILSCQNRDKDRLLVKYSKKNKINHDQKSDEKTFYQNNLENINNGYPFYIIQKNAILLIDEPDYSIPQQYIILKFGDVVFPTKHQKNIDNFFYVRTINNNFGWIDSSYGISLNYNEDKNLYFFNEDYYLKRYKDTNGNIDDSDIVILTKNIVPMLLDNYKTFGWFYPSDYNLALDLAKNAVLIAKDKDTFFHSASSYNWAVNEVVICNNLLSDCYHKLRQFDKAIEIHEKLLKSYFWKRADNTQIGGINSSVKLTKIYVDKLKEYSKNSLEYKNTMNKMLDTILITGDSYSIFTVMDKEWHLTASEWLMVILQNNLTIEEFYQICDLLIKRTTSTGFADLVLIYKALSMYKNGEQDEALSIIKQINSKDIAFRSGKIENWIKDNNIIPESVIYQYNF